MRTMNPAARRLTACLIAAAAAWLAVGAGPALADCILNGVPFPEGTRIGGLVCENGEWVDG